MNKYIKNLITSSILLALASPLVNAQDAIGNDLCAETGVVFAFFNGVQTTVRDANRANGEFARLYGNANDSGEKINYEIAYNYTDGFGDFVETFEQRLLEQEDDLNGRYELFFESLRGDGPWWSAIGEAIPRLIDVRDGWVDWYKAQVIQKLTSLYGSASPEINYGEHRSRIDNWVVEGKKLLFVAHSQGNLFANAAYNYASSQVPAGAVKVVHIAPASPLTNGAHVLADKDIVIDGLRAVGSVPAVTDTIPGYLVRPAGINGQKDILGHGLLEIYLNQHLDTAASINIHINDALNSMTAPPADATSGFFTATLTWDGQGDVDLHVFEPAGKHVYYANMGGDAGYLDVDNVNANGPEHYYAACNSNQLLTGTYEVKLANYARATGRTATVQIASWEDGVMGTTAVTVQEPTGNNPIYHMFNVNVNRDADTGVYGVTVDRPPTWGPVFSD